MTTITFTDLQLRVTLAQWRKAQMPQWGERDWKMHLHDECVRYLNGNGKAKVFGVTIEDLADRGMTDWDKAGVEAPVGDKSTTPRVGAGVTDVAAAPADPYEPVGTEAVVGDTVEIRGQLFEVKKASGTAFVTDERGGAIYGCDQRAPTYRILKRQAAPAPATDGLQVWRDTRARLYMYNGKLIVASKRPWGWRKWGGSDCGLLSTDTRLPAAEEAREIAAAREAGVLWATPRS